MKSLGSGWRAGWVFGLTLVFVSGCLEVPGEDGPRFPTPDVFAAPPSSGRPVPTADAGTTTAGDLVDLGAAPDGACLAPAEADIWTAEVLRLTNEARRANGAPPVAWSDALATQAEAYACEMIELDFFAHVNPDTGETLRDRADRYSYTYWAIGENLAGGQTTPAQVVREWLESPSHRENMLNPAYSELGIGVRIGGEYRIYWVQEFGRPLSDGPPDDR